MSDNMNIVKSIFILSLFLFILLMGLSYINSIYTDISTGYANSPEVNPPFCPVATQNPPPRVEPVTSPTHMLSQKVYVDFPVGEVITITAESGTFFEPCDLNAFMCSTAIDVRLLPNTTHHLLVIGRVRKTNWNGCEYGGYTMDTTTDHYGAPLIITQEFSGDIIYIPIILSGR